MPMQSYDFKGKVINLEAYKSVSRNKNDFDATNTAVNLLYLLNTYKVSGNPRSQALLQSDE